MKKLIAYYLPQFHETEDNNKWWGKGFTEWTALDAAETYFNDQKIRKPTELGYYDLSNVEEIHKQYRLAAENNIYAFCLWTYWFGEGEKALEMPLKQLLSNPGDVQYCIAWANHSWMNKTKGILLKEQKYLGKDDYKRFFEYMLPHFLSNNYIKHENKPVVTIFDPKSVPDLEVFISTWDVLAKENGFSGVYFIGDYTRDHSWYAGMLSAYLDSSKMFLNRTVLQKIREKLVRVHKVKLLGPVVYDYKKMIGELWKDKSINSKEIPVIYSGWDTTIRHKRLGVYFKNFSADLFKINVKQALHYNDKNDYVFIKSWNEWAEGNVLEPDTIYGTGLLRIIADEMKNKHA